MRTHGWGRYPVIDAESSRPATVTAAAAALLGHATVTPRGLGRSYGDSALGDFVVDATGLDCLLEFDESTGRLRCGAGVSLATILSVFLPRGWLPPVTPGTRHVTIGGAIASDVHGKNHHVDGCFSSHVESFRLLLASGAIVNCSRTENAPLFHATCGGMGLTGLLLEATLHLKRVASAYIAETTFRTANLEETLALFDATAGATYSVAWIDCLARGAALGRSLLMTGEHVVEGGLAMAGPARLAIPVDFPSWTLNSWSIAAFNALYYHRVFRSGITRQVHCEKFFYPLDGIRDWNRMYGARGFLQYQFVIPRATGAPALAEILRRIAASGRGSFLAVLKAFGAANDNFLSFPLEGYTLALDFPLDASLLAFLDGLDAVVAAAGGRVYLTKDARMSASVFRSGYPRWEEFQEVRRAHGAIGRFRSLQSMRLGLEP